MIAGTNTNDTVETLLDRIVALRPMPTRPQREFALRLYRQLSQGKPVRAEELAETLNRRSPDMRQMIDTWPAGVQLDESKRVVGFGGLSLEPSPHRFNIDGRTLYTWCAWDSLFIPGILNQTAHVESTCPETGQDVSITLSPNQLGKCDPARPVLSFLLPDSNDLHQDVRKNFCAHVHFFASPQDGTAWIQGHEGTFLLTLEQAFDLGKRKNAAQFGESLNRSMKP